MPPGKRLPHPHSLVIPLYTPELRSIKIFLPIGLILFQSELPGMSPFHSLQSGPLPKKTELDGVGSLPACQVTLTAMGWGAAEPVLAQHLGKHLWAGQICKDDSQLWVHLSGNGWKKRNTCWMPSCGLRTFQSSFYTIICDLHSAATVYQTLS